MLSVWVHSLCNTITTVLAANLSALGYEVQLEPVLPTDLAIWHLGNQPGAYVAAPLMPTLALVEGGSEEELARLLLLGYRGYLLDYRDRRGLALALEALAKDELHADGLVIGLAMTKAFGRRGGLTVEQERMVSLAQIGLSNHEIAERLGIGVGRVQSELRLSYKKLGIKGRGQLKKEG